MKKKTLKKVSHKESVPRKCRVWLWVLIALLSGFVIGYATHYTIINWHGFFAVCPNGDSPDKNGCCSGEVYTDAGDGWMVCCPDGGDNCFPPVR